MKVWTLLNIYTRHKLLVKASVEKYFVWTMKGPNTKREMTTNGHKRDPDSKLSQGFSRIVCSRLQSFGMSRVVDVGRFSLQCRRRYDAAVRQGTVAKRHHAPPRSRGAKASVPN